MSLSAALLAILLVVNTALWRFAPGWWVLPVSGLAVMGALAAGIRRDREEWLPWLGLGAFLVTCFYLADPMATWTGQAWWGKVWPCETACQGGKFYHTFFKADLGDSDSGIPTWAPALVAYLGLVVLGLAGRRWQRLGALAQLLLWGCLGASVYYLVLSTLLGMLCGHCLAIHTVVLCGLAVGIRSEVDWRFRLGAGLVAGLLLHAVYHPVALTQQGPSSLPPPLPPPPAGAVPEANEGTMNFMNEGRPQPAVAGVLSADDLHYLCRVDRGRRLGSPTAPYRVEFVVNLTCPHCEESFNRMHAAWQGLIDAGRVEVVFRHKFRWQEDKDRALARFALAAGVVGDYRAALFAILGVDDRLAADERVEAIARRGLAVAPVKAEEERHRALLDRLLHADATRLADPKRSPLRGTPPIIRVTGPGMGARGKVWRGTAIDFTSIAEQMVGDK